MSTRPAATTIAESEPPAGLHRHVRDRRCEPDDLAHPDVSIAAGTWVNTLGSVSWVKNGPDGSSLLGGATFLITPNPRTGSGSLVVVDNGSNDADPDAGELRVNNARTGTYSVQETIAPAGYILDAAPASMTVSAATPNPSIATGTFVNHLGKIRWLKHGPDGTTLLGGATSASHRPRHRHGHARRGRLRRRPLRRRRP